MTWQDITIRQFQELAGIEAQGGSDFDTKVAKVAYLEGKTMEQMDALSIGALNELLQKYKPLFEPVADGQLLTEWKHGGYKYRLVGDIRDINAGQFNELVHFAKGDNVVPNLHYVMATLVKVYRRKWLRWVEVKKDHAKVAEAMLQAPYHLAHKSAVFFCKLYLSFLASTRDFFLSQLRMMGKSQQEAEQEYLALLNILAGCITPRV